MTTCGGTWADEAAPLRLIRLYDASVYLYDHPVQ
jgi:hypothetical protein